MTSTLTSLISRRRGLGLTFRIVLIPPFCQKVKRLSHDSHEKSESITRLSPLRAIWTRNNAFASHRFKLSSPSPARGNAKPFDQRFRGLYILKLRLNFDQVPVVFVCGIGGERRFRLFQLLM